jgi:hypothetical protein
VIRKTTKEGIPIMKTEAKKTKTDDEERYTGDNAFRCAY